MFSTGESVCTLRQLVLASLVVLLTHREILKDMTFGVDVKDSVGTLCHLILASCSLDRCSIDNKYTTLTLLVLHPVLHLFLLLAAGASFIRRSPGPKCDNL